MSLYALVLMLGPLLGLVVSAPCSRYYVDVGTNIGSQVHKLYNASCGGQVQSIFKKHFGEDRLDVCAIGIEPNPKHAATLDAAERHYVEGGIHVRFIKAAASTEDGTATLSMNDNDEEGSKHNFWKAGLSASPSAGQVNVSTVNVAAILKSLPKHAKVVMKLDVEGHETKLLPQLVDTKALCRVAEMYIETHGKASEDAFWAAAKSLKAMGCDTTLTWMDDESNCRLPSFFPPQKGQRHEGPGRKLAPKTDSLLASLTGLADQLAGQDDDATPDVISPTLSLDKGVCVYLMHMHTTKGLKRSQDARAELERQGVPYNMVAARHGRGGHWPLTCIDQTGIGPGYIGMWRTYLAAWRRAAQSCKSDWALFLESDAVIPSNLIERFADARRYHPPARALWLDERNMKMKSASGCCTVSTAWHRSSWPTLIGDFSPHNQTAWHVDYKTNKDKWPIVKDGTCLTDLYLSNVVAGRSLPAASYPIVRHPKGAREIGTV